MDQPIDFNKLELDLTEQVTGNRPAVRRDCAFCSRERTPKDDNHDLGCVYWDLPGLHEGINDA